MSLLRFTLFLGFIACQAVAQAQLYTFRNYDHRDGLIMESSLSTVQDHQGYLWIGMDGAGLMRFDGKKFSEVGPKGKSVQYHVSSIFPKADGTIYFAALYDGVFKLADNQYQFVYKPTLRDGDSKFISMVDSNIVLVCDRSISIISEGGKLIRKLFLSSSKNIVVHQVLKIPQGVLLFTNSGNYIVQKSRIKPLTDIYKSGNHLVFFEPKFGTFLRNKLTLYDGSMRTKLELLLSKSGAIFKQTKLKTNFLSSSSWLNNDSVALVTERQGVAFIATTRGKLYRVKGGKLTRIVENYSKKLSSITHLHADKNLDLWINTDYGLIKVSIEPFTKVELSPIYENKTIGVIHRTKSGKLVLGTMTNELYIGKLYSSEEPKLYNLRCYQVVETSLGILLATDKGIQELVGEELRPTRFPMQANKPISLIHWDGQNLWYSPRGDGIISYNPTTKKIKTYSQENLPLGEFTFPSHFYTAQNNVDFSVVYFGSNSGVYEYSKAKQQFRKINVFERLGAYCGVSTKDRYGTCWFTMDKGIVGITSEQKYVTIEGDRRLPSTLFYTLSADQFGNLLAGTNKGINIIEVDRYGSVLKTQNYSHNEGFGGYETNMRAQFQSSNYSFVGTIEGLFLINTEVLREFPAPPIPIVLFGRENGQGGLESNSDQSYFTFKCLLPKSEAVMFSYRLIGKYEKWSDFSTANELYLPDLSNGKYTLQVRASYDGVSISETASYTINIDLPIWQTKWFIVVIVIFLGLLNIGYLEWSKSYLSNNIFNTQDTTVNIKTIPRLILFAVIVNGSMLFIVDIVEPILFATASLNLMITTMLTALFLVSRFFVKNRVNHTIVFTCFYIGYAAILFEDFYLIFDTNIHPFPVFSITIATSIIPFIVSRIRYVILICSLQLFIAACLLIWLEDTIYNEILFIAAITISGALAVMVTYLRNDSLEKLIFINGVINQGNVMAISFDQRGTVTYCSENISDFFAIDSTTVVGKPAAILNPFVVSSEMREINLHKEFDDGRIFIMPMYNKKAEVVWVEWSCKYFNDAVRVIMGQDVTDKLMLSNNYQSLVENAQDMIFNTDVNGNFLFANERCVNLFGYRNEAIIGKSSISLIAPDHRERVHQFYVEQFKNRIHNTYLEFPIRSRDGRIFWVGQNVTMLYEPGSRKRISGFIALARDITEKRANDLLIEQQNKDITSSINYAKRIQYNLLPNQELLHRYFEQTFLVFKPKDIVSGDFYWLQEVDNKLILVVADCTGHGVPGAFMTILGINLLNQIVRERKQYEPEVILEQLNTELQSILPQQEGVMFFDSMDVLVTVFETDKVHFASSGVPFIHQQGENLVVYRSTKRIADNEILAFDQQTIEFSNLDSFYLITDGYQKQLGSIRDKKFGSKRIQELLHQIKGESLPLQKKYFENALQNWSEGTPQTDDITVIGLRGFKTKK